VAIADGVVTGQDEAGITDMDHHQDRTDAVVTVLEEGEVMVHQEAEEVDMGRHPEGTDLE
jgi:hypothetical protein